MEKFQDAQKRYDNLKEQEMHLKSERYKLDVESNRQQKGTYLLLYILFQRHIAANATKCLIIVYLISLSAKMLNI